ncbi:MAG: GspE/PulE family protein [Phycisphaeraceae bacterium]
MNRLVAERFAGVNTRAQRLAEILVSRGHLTREQLDDAGRHHADAGLSLIEFVTQRYGLEESTLREARLEEAGIEVVSLAEQTLDADALKCVPAHVAMRHKAVPFALRGRSLRVAMVDPFDEDVIEQLRVVAGKRIDRCFAPEHEFLEAVKKAYGSQVSRMVADLGSSQQGANAKDGDETVVDLEQLASEPSVVNLVNLVLLEAVEARASDVHVEPFENKVKFKYRIDGVLHEVDPPPVHLYAAIVSRIKIMGAMNIAERFVPQDGHTTFTTPAGKVDVRISTVPTVHGESVVMRLLNRAAGLIGLEQLGMSRRYLEPFQHILDRPHGIVLVTGPTGSGKTTTLYASINRIYSPQRKIITIEDPVEYQLDGVNQIPVNAKRGVDFATGLRSILRQDPDVIMVGEIRDRETADIAIRSALTGHLVFSTLHTNDAVGAVTRLLDMGVEPFLLASSLEGVLAQRLVRQICPYCREAVKESPEAVRRLGHRASEARATTFYHGRGCSRCRNTGYAGRTGIFELVRITEAMHEVIQRRGSTAEMLANAAAEHRPMWEDGYEKAVAGHTTLEEVLRVTQDTPAEAALTLDDE